MFETFREWREYRITEIEKLKDKITDLKKIRNCDKEEKDIKTIEKLLNSEFDIESKEENENLKIHKELLKIIKDNNDCVEFDQLWYDITQSLIEFNESNESEEELKCLAFDYAIDTIQCQKSRQKKQKKIKPKIKMIPHNSWEPKLSKRQLKKQKKREQRELRKSRKQEKKYRRGQVSFQLEQYIG
tara:strand:- start:6642 stop:7199 length:558 start_codon:yes stop_codon:yes gene_type:complete